MKTMQPKLAIILLMVGFVFVGCTPSGGDLARQSQTTTPNSQATNSNSIENANMAKNEKYDEAPPVLSSEELKEFTNAVITTDRGKIEVTLNAKLAPKTVSNFVFLVQEGFYNGLNFHRREEGFVVQGGDPLGNGTGGPGYTVEGEYDNGLKHERGAIAMARLSDTVNPQKRSSGSQFYIALDDVNFLDGEYTVFGKVTKGMDVVDKLQVGDVITKIEFK